jgi:hypothetical protein
MVLRKQRGYATCAHMPSLACGFWENLPPPPLPQYPKHFHISEKLLFTVSLTHVIWYKFLRKFFAEENN